MLSTFLTSTESVAEWLRRLTSDPGVVSSSPARDNFFYQSVILRNYYFFNCTLLRHSYYYQYIKIFTFRFGLLCHVSEVNILYAFIIMVKLIVIAMDKK